MGARQLVGEGAQPLERIIDRTVEAFAELAPRLLMPAHCTGWKAVHLLAELPETCVMSTVGTTVSL